VILVMPEHTLLDSEVAVESQMAFVLHRAIGMKTTGAKVARPLLDWVLSRGQENLAFQVKRAGKRYEVSVSSPGLKKRLYGKFCRGGVNALQLHATLVAGFRDAGWTSVAYR
jgi:hypothetical protein